MSMIKIMNNIYNGLLVLYLVKVNVCVVFLTFYCLRYMLLHVILLTLVDYVSNQRLMKLPFPVHYCLGYLIVLMLKPCEISACQPVLLNVY